jgi:hypothetical protein
MVTFNIASIYLPDKEILYVWPRLATPQFSCTISTSTGLLCAMMMFFPHHTHHVVSTSISAIVMRDFLWYIFLRRIVSGPKPPGASQLSRKTGVIMVTSSFGPYHGLKHEDTPTKHTDLILTPWTMTCALGLVWICQAHKEIVTLLTVVFCYFLECTEYWWHGGRLAERKGWG